MSDDGLTAFCRARLGEDEAEDWNVHTGDCPSSGPLQLQCKCGYPARVLREVEAKRAILRRFAELDADPARLTDPVKHAIWTVMRDYVVLPIVAVYSDHPGYRAEWKP